MGTALLVMDVQVGTVERQGDAVPLDRLAEAVATARTAEVPVIHVRISFRPGFPDVSPANKSFGEIRRHPDEARIEGHPGRRIHPAVAPLPGEPEVVKKRVSAFTGSDLELLLRSSDIDHLVLCGIATGGVVLSTVREAADRDYGLTVLSDACGDADAEVHRVLIERVFPRQAEVLTVAEWGAALRGG